MTDFKKIENYYKSFDEWDRLDGSEGKLEFEILIQVIKKYLPEKSTVFDLGGGPGRYTIALSKAGHKMYLADLSPELISIAKKKIKQYGNIDNIIGIDVCNALDLSNYRNEMFDAVILFGPLYHMTTEKEVSECLNETFRVLKNKGKILAVFIPWITGLAGVLDRLFQSPNQVNPKILNETFERGIFNNLSNKGFQEGAFYKTERMLEFFSKAGYKQLLLRSVRGIGYNREKSILALKETDINYYENILKIINESSCERSIVDTCGHVIYIGEK